MVCICCQPENLLYALTFRQGSKVYDGALRALGVLLRGVGLDVGGVARVGRQLRQQVEQRLQVRARAGQQRRAVLHRHLAAVLCLFHRVVLYVPPAIHNTRCWSELKLSELFAC